MSDADRDGALSRVEFAVAMHLASCSAHKGLSVPSALPGPLAALLPKKENKKRNAPVAKDGKNNSRGKADQKLEKSSARASAEGRNERGHPHRSVGAGDEDAGSAGLGETGGAAAGGKSSAAARNKGGSQGVGEGGHQRGRAGRNKKSGSKQEVGKVGQAQVPRNAGNGAGGKMGKRAAEAEKENKAQKKRGFGTLSASTDTSAVSKRPGVGDEAPASKSTAETKDRGGKKKKRPKTKEEGDEREDPQGRKEPAAVAGKRTSSSGIKQRAGSKLLTAKSSKAEKERDSSAVGGGGVGGTVVGGDSTESIAKGKHAGHVADRENGSSTMTKQSEEAGDGDDEESTWTYEGDAPNGEKKKKTNLTGVEEDQLYAMTTSERAGYDVIFMQVPQDLFLATR